MGLQECNDPKRNVEGDSLRGSITVNLTTGHYK